MIFKVIEFVNKTKPNLILLENVKHLVRHNNFETYKQILDAFKKNGYILIDNDLETSPLILSPKMFNLMQSRERVFIPLIKEKTKLKNIYYDNDDIDNFIKNHIGNINIFEDDKKEFLLPDYEQKILSAWEEFVNHFSKKKMKIPIIYLDEMLKKNGINRDKYKKYEWYKKYCDNMKHFYANNKDFIDKWNAKYEPLKNWKVKKYRKLEWNASDTKFKDAYLQIRQSGLRFSKNRSFPALVAIVQVPIIFSKKYKKWRYLTPRETANLQSFPKEFQLCKNNHEAYKQFGNSVNVKVVEFVIRKYFLKYLGVSNE